MRKNTFSDCATLKEVFIGGTGFPTKAGEAIATIGERAFENCTGLEEITIPASVTRIGDGAFKGCSSLRSITLLSMTPPTVGKDVLEGSGCTVLVPSDAVLAYEGAPGWHTPHADDFQKLIDQCVWTSATREGVSGYEITSKTNGARIFLPASGTVTNSRGAYSLSDFGRSIVYWSASLDPSYAPFGFCIYAGLTSSPKTVISNTRYSGMYIRGVTY